MSPDLRRLPVVAVAAVAALLLWAVACGADTETVEPDDPSARVEAMATRSEVADSGSIEQPAGPVRVGTTLTVAYELPKDSPPGAWLGLIPAEHGPRDEVSNDAVDVAWIRLEPADREAELALGAAPPGRYRLRIFSADDETGTLLAESDPFEIEAWELLSTDAESGPALAARLVVTVDGRELAPGSTLPADGPFQVRYEVSQELPAKAWLGMVPASVTGRGEAENDAEDVRFEYVDGTSGTVEMGTPDAGEYVVRLFPCDEAVCSAIAQVGPFRSTNSR